MTLLHFLVLTDDDGNGDGWVVGRCSIVDSLATRCPWRFFGRICDIAFSFGR